MEMEGKVDLWNLGREDLWRVVRKLKGSGPARP
jgi:hypothetical protein